MIYIESRIKPIVVYFRKNTWSWWLGWKPREVNTEENFANQARSTCLRWYKAFLSLQTSSGLGEQSKEGTM